MINKKLINNIKDKNFTMDISLDTYHIITNIAVIVNIMVINIIDIAITNNKVFFITIDL